MSVHESSGQSAPASVALVCRRLALQYAEIVSLSLVNVLPRGVELSRIIGVGGARVFTRLT